MSRPRDGQDTLRDYLGAVTRAEEEERRRLARDLHDDTVQTLIALVHRLDRCERAADDPDQLSCRLEETRELAGQALDSLRRVIHNLRPLYLEDLGLVPAAEALIQETTRRDGAPSIRFLTAGAAQRLPPEIELTAYRVLQEALNNVVRHARASEARVTLHFGEAELRLAVQDDGVGFVPPDPPEQLARGGHFGLIGMRERALRLGGALLIDSSPGHDVSLALILPRSVTPTALPPVD